MILKNTIYYNYEQKQIVNQILKHLSYDAYLFGKNVFDYKFVHQYDYIDNNKINYLIKNQLFRKRPIVFVFNEHVMFNDYKIRDLFDNSQHYNIYCLSHTKNNFFYDHYFDSYKDLMSLINKTQIEMKITDFYFDDINKNSFIKINGNSTIITKKLLNILSKNQIIVSNKNCYDNCQLNLNDVIKQMESQANINKVLVIDSSVTNFNDNSIKYILRNHKKYSTTLIINTYNKVLSEDFNNLIDFTFIHDKNDIHDYCKNKNIDDTDIENIVVTRNKICKFKNKLLNYSETKIINLTFFDWSKISQKSNILVVGSRRSGKTTMLKYILKNINDDYQASDEGLIDFDNSKTNIITSQCMFNRTNKFIDSFDYFVFFKDNENYIRNIYNCINCNSMSALTFIKLMANMDDNQSLVYDKKENKFYWCKAFINEDMDEWEIIENNNNKNIVYRIVINNNNQFI